MASTKPQQEEKKKSADQQMIIFQLGTNNWQWADEAAPGSGILHEAHHNAYNAMPNVRSYSIYPSQKHCTADIANNDDDLVRIYKLDSNIPVCESSSPVSKRRWHAMSQQEVDKYRSDLEQMTYDYLLAIEQKHGANCLFAAVAHHTFMNCVVLRNVMKRREDKGLHIPLCMVFCHGTALKMYQNELREEREFTADDNKENDDAAKARKGKREFPLKFYPWINELGLFANADKKGFINVVLANSPKVIDEFTELFPAFDAKRCVLNYPGYNQNVFRVHADLQLDAVLKSLALQPIMLDDAQNVTRSEDVIGAQLKYDGLVTFVGKLADWKRMDLVMAASEIYDANFEKAGKKVLTLLVGGGMVENQVVYLKQLQALKNKNIFYVGPQMQPILCQLWNVSDVGVYPSKNEPFGMVFIETMACGTPVIGAKSGGPVDFVNEKVGVLVDENDSKEVMVADIAKHVTQFVLEQEKNKRKDDCVKCANSFDVVGMQKKLLQDLDALLK